MERLMTIEHKISETIYVMINYESGETYMVCNKVFPFGNDETATTGRYPDVRVLWFNNRGMLNDAMEINK